MIIACSFTNFDRCSMSVNLFNSCTVSVHWLRIRGRWGRSGLSSGILFETFPITSTHSWHTISARASCQIKFYLFSMILVCAQRFGYFKRPLMEKHSFFFLWECRVRIITSAATRTMVRVGKTSVLTGSRSFELVVWWLLRIVFAFWKWGSASL